MRYVTVFGDSNGFETSRVRRSVEEWAESEGVLFQYREVTPLVRAEYNIKVVPTVRYHNTRSKAPRTEARGRKAVTRFLGEAA